MALDLELGNKTAVFSLGVKLGLIGLSLGVVLFFKSASLRKFFALSLSTGLLLGTLGLLYENMNRLRLIPIFLVISAAVIVFNLQFFIAPSCSLTPIADINAEVGENIFTSETKINIYSGERECADLLPWYYRDISGVEREEKINEYCNRNLNDSSYCQLKCKQSNNSLSC